MKTTRIALISIIAVFVLFMIHPTTSVTLLTIKALIILMGFLLMVSGTKSGDEV